MKLVAFKVFGWCWAFLYVAILYASLGPLCIAGEAEFLQGLHVVFIVVGLVALVLPVTSVKLRNRRLLSALFPYAFSLISLATIVAFSLVARST